MTLRPVQALALRDIGVQGGGFLPVGVGEGKTLISLLAPYLLGARKPMMLLPAGLIEKTERERAVLAKHWLIPTNIRLYSYDLLGREQAAAELEEYAPDAITCDECFVTGTQVRTPEGLRSIEDIKAGDSVWAFDGSVFSVQSVQDAWSRETEETWLLTVEQETYETTGNHPFLTDKGWMRASDCKAGDSIVCDVREEFLLPVAQEEAAVLRPKLFCEMANVSTGDQSQGLQCGGQRKDIRNAPEQAQAGPLPRLLRTHDAEKPNAFGRDTSKGERGPSRQGASPESARRQWPSDVEATSDSGSRARCWLGHGEAHSMAGEVRHPGLPHRHLSRGVQGRCRGRREISSVACCSIKRREEDKVPRATRLASVASVERRDRSGPGQSCRVHNLRVAGSSTYVLGSGLVVHNCHRLKNLRAACTRRVARYMHKHPKTAFVGMSGTVMRDSLNDFAHILFWALKDQAPLPMEPHELADWAAALDEPKPGRFGDEWDRIDPGALLDLCIDEERQLDPYVAARRGFRRRLTDTPGIVATAGDGERVDCSISITGHVYELSRTTDAHFARLRDDMERPDGYELLSGVDVWRHAKELALGFNSKWVPDPPPEWLLPRKRWGAFVRAYLSRSRTLDSPDQVKQGVLAGAIDDGGLLEKWLAVSECEGAYEPNIVEVWHDDSVLKLCAKWARGPGIVWTDHTFFAERLAKETGLPYYGAQGLDAAGTYIEDSPSKTIIASIDANRDGKNLQHKWSRNLLVGPPDGWDALQQCIARTHRPGQTADEVIVDVLIGCREHVSAWRKAVAGTHAAADTIGGTPKLLLADVSFPTESEIAALSGSRW
jgi:hypothetical protein